MYSVLIVDDEERTRKTLIKIGQWEKHRISRIEQAADGLKAFGMICEMQPDIVILDMNMPRLDGADLLKRLQQNEIKTKVIVASGYGDYKYTHLSILYGSVDYLLKPINRELLNKAVNRAVAALDAEKADRHKADINVLFPNSARVERLINTWDGGGDNRTFCFIAVLSEPQARDDLFFAFSGGRHHDTAILEYIGGYNPQYYLLFAEEGMAPETVRQKIKATILSGELTACTVVLGDTFADEQEYGRYLGEVKKLVQYVPVNELHGKVKTRQDIGIDTPGISEEIVIGGAEAATARIDELYGKIAGGEYGTLCKIRRGFMQYMDGIKQWCESRHIKLDFVYDAIHDFEMTLSAVDKKDILMQIERIRTQIGSFLLQEEAQDRNMAENIRAYIDHYYYKRITLDTLANSFNFSKEHIAREFKKQFDVSVISYLNQVRLGKAEKMIGQGIDADTACEQAGYNDVNYFAKLFKKQYGATPKSYGKRGDR